MRLAKSTPRPPQSERPDYPETEGDEQAQGVVSQLPPVGSASNTPPCDTPAGDIAPPPLVKLSISAKGGHLKWPSGKIDNRISAVSNKPPPPRAVARMRCFLGASSGQYCHIGRNRDDPCAARERTDERRFSRRERRAMPLKFLRLGVRARRAFRIMTAQCSIYRLRRIRAHR